MPELPEVEFGRRQLEETLVGEKLAKLDPRRRANTLTLEDAGQLARALTEIIEKAVDVDGDADRYPEGWLFHRRFSPSEGMAPAMGDPIELLTVLTVAGRTTVWVPAR